jgi:hypothetical protein
MRAAEGLIFGWQEPWSAPASYLPSSNSSAFKTQSTRFVFDSARSFCLDAPRPDIAMTGRSYRLKDHAIIAGKEDKNKKIKPKPNEPSIAEPAS